MQSPPREEFPQDGVDFQTISFCETQQILWENIFQEIPQILWKKRICENQRILREKVSAKILKFRGRTISVKLCEICWNKIPRKSANSAGENSKSETNYLFRNYFYFPSINEQVVWDEITIRCFIIYLYLL